MKNNQRKKIGIVGYLTENVFGVGFAYMYYFSKFGDVSIINHTESEIRKDLDLIVIPGGPDVDTRRYLKEDEPLDLTVGKPCPIRERFDKDLLPKYIENGTPIFGICRGHQTLAVHFGGTLVQDMYHETNPKDRRDVKVHSVSFNNKMLQSIGIKLLTANKQIAEFQDVNSIHHQVVDQIPENAVSIANYKVKKNSYDDIPYNEALYYPNMKIASVQWHPEEIEDPLSNSLINHLLYS